MAIRHFYRFEAFTIDTDQKILLRDGKPLPLTPKLFDTLLILVENGGRLVHKQELMSRLWPDSFVEEANLTSNIQHLRKTLGDNARRPHYIETVARRGYRFIADVEEVLGNDAATPRRVANQFETFDSLDATNENLRPTNLSSSILSEPRSASKPAASPRISAIKKRIALMIVVASVLLVSGLILWRLAIRANGNLSELMATLPLKMERLTATGHSKLVAISPDGKYLAYTHAVSSNESIWLRQLTTNTNIELIRGNDAIYGLAFAHSGEYLYFVMGNPSSLYRISLFGGVPIRILSGLEGKFSLAPDDRRVAFVRGHRDDKGDQKYSLMVANSDGSAERTLLEQGYAKRLDAPVWSPDGESIVCAAAGADDGSQNVGLIEVTLTDGVTKELSAERFTNIIKIVWMPQRNGLIMSAGKTAGDDRQLWLISYPGMEFRPITAGPVSYSDLSITADGHKLVASETTRASDLWVGQNQDLQHLKKVTAAMDNFCWTPDRRLVYSSMVSGTQDLWMMQPDGTGQRQLTARARANGTPAVTPDNRYIVFVSNRTGAFQIWRSDIDGANQVQLTDGSGKNFPTVSPDGKWVLYNSTNNWEVWKVSIDGGQPVRIIEQPVYFLAISPDGKMIACLGRSESKASILILPFEGGQPLKTFDLGGQNFSGTRIQWTPDGRALLYAIKRDGVTTLLKQPLNASRAEEVTRFEDELFDFGFSPDGQLLAVTSGGWQHDVILISDLNYR